ncbi:MAG: SDR family NAD(P)-dependent oxidoreductase [Chloroflexi bacterium]|nr:SDR family NAD(P)-dependent oxidoreductase [Chloroflexota bacterium]MBI3170298.1 SDR family NAD(P)-dependent oxidoreductase [Chloroflexota bacterium]
MLKNKVVLITGAGKGIGRKLAEELAARGAIIAANDISPINVEAVVDGIRAKGGQAKAYLEDVAKKVGAQMILKSVEDDFGTIDVLINHAAVEPHMSLLDMDEWDWHRTIDVNLTGAFLMAQTAGRVMRAKGSGVIVNLVAGTGEKEKEAGAYRAGKAGLAELSHQLARELNPQGVKVVAALNFEEALKTLEEV